MKGHLYHVFNRGNNRETIFYNEANYRHFIEKITKYIKPYADILAWCLMPNHFHLMIEVREEEINGRSLNDSIGILLRSYARAINIQEDRVGSLFQSKTKAINLTNPKGAFFTNRNYFLGPAYIYLYHKSQYPNKCLDYIHKNPVSAGLAVNPGEWEFSSYREYLGMGKYNLSDPKKGWKYLQLSG
jgi:putative transposase